MDKSFETERVYARNWSPDDAWEAFESYMSDPEVGPRAGWLPHRSPEESREYLNDVVRPGVEMCLVYKPTGKIIGAIGLLPDKLRIAERVYSREIGFVLAIGYWGMGLMRDAVGGVAAGVEVAPGGVELLRLSGDGRKGDGQARRSREGSSGGQGGSEHEGEDKF